MTRQEFVSNLNLWGAARKPFLFITDFELENFVAVPISDIDSPHILYDINGFSNAGAHPSRLAAMDHAEFVPFASYKKSFDVVYRHLNYGDSYLTNLTTKTPVRLSHDLQEYFYAARARYKLFYRDQFVVFSPECFIKIDAGKICSFPMKGTIDATLPDARQIILNDQKELAEHVTIVDLIRNDLSQVSSNVRVTRFRYIDELRTTNKILLQVSSEIVGDLPTDFYGKLGDILISLLPAGSVSGAPKEKTVQIIREAENEKRGYYTGVFGYFDGQRLDSGVMIRYIERENDNFYYRSGGGITTQSTAEKEYQEIMDKVYVPVT
jgi:para-aminobenzoate synthetase component I